MIFNKKNVGTGQKLWKIQKWKGKEIYEMRMFSDKIELAGFHWSLKYNDLRFSDQLGSGSIITYEVCSTICLVGDGFWLVPFISLRTELRSQVTNGKKQFLTPVSSNWFFLHLVTKDKLVYETKTFKKFAFQPIPIRYIMFMLLRVSFISFCW